MTLVSQILKWPIISLRIMAKVPANDQKTLSITNLVSPLWFLLLFPLLVTSPQPAGLLAALWTHQPCPCFQRLLLFFPLLNVPLQDNCLANFLASSQSLLKSHLVSESPPDHSNAYCKCLLSSALPGPLILILFPFWLQLLSASNTLYNFLICYVYLITSFPTSSISQI